MHSIGDIVEYTNEEIENFVSHIQESARQKICKDGSISTAGFVLGCVNPSTQERQKSFVTYLRSSSSNLVDLDQFVDIIHQMALASEAEVAGMIAHTEMMWVSDDEEGPFTEDDFRNNPSTGERVILYVEHIYSGQRFYQSNVIDVNGTRSLTPFEQVEVMPSADNLSFIPQQLYGTPAEA